MRKPRNKSKLSRSKRIRAVQVLGIVGKVAGNRLRRGPCAPRNWVDRPPNFNGTFVEWKGWRRVAERFVRLCHVCCKGYYITKPDDDAVVLLGP